MKKHILSTTVLTFLWIVLSYIQNWHIKEIMNITFMVGLISLTIFVLIHIVQSGFLDLLLNGFKRLGRLMLSKSNAMKRADEQASRDKELQNFLSRWQRLVGSLFLHVSLSSLLISCCMLIIYYQSY